MGEVAQASTITHSKAGAESTDKDQEGRIQSMMATMTKTDANREASDSDPARITLGINTHTYTETNRETTDQDK
ncbi:hypothetical protein LEP1GSC192_0482 [Leptospira sp. B5-022]|nr:hypothetical protein LEP1GSC192_0482 [Leptospira sp. B5-022]